MATPRRSARISANAAVASAAQSTSAAAEVAKSTSLDQGSVSKKRAARVKAATRTKRPAQNSPLLDLPAELRNSIYRYTLVNAAPVEADTRKGAAAMPLEPALLQTCSQIRSEATEIFFQENTFNITVVDYDVTMLSEWMQASKSRRGCNSMTFPEGTPNWKNFLEWLEGFWYGELHSFGFPKSEMPGSDRHADAASHCFHLVGELRELKQFLSWSDIQPALESHHQALAALDKAWA